MKIKNKKDGDEEDKNDKKNGDAVDKLETNKHNKGIRTGTRGYGEVERSKNYIGMRGRRKNLNLN